MKNLKALLFSAFALAATIPASAQYNFKIEKKNNCTEVKNQGRTGTCWSFATASFLESELIRMGHDNINLSEMFIVRNIYKDKAANYILRQGKANFSEGSLAHDLIRMTERAGLMTEEAYPGKVNGQDRHDHAEMADGLKGFLDGIRKSKALSTKWKAAFSSILDTYLGEAPEQFSHDGKQYTAKSFAKKTQLRSKNYLSIGSFTHHPFYEQFILEVPDNYSNGSFYNVPLDEMMALIDYALLAGYTISWDGDVSEKGFSARNGIAVLAEDSSREDLFINPGKEESVTQESRQANFESYRTTDDHLMHIVGVATDQKGTKYYLTKNSWGEISDHKGYLYMSENYLRMKTISVMVHKDGLPKITADKLISSAN